MVLSRNKSLTVNRLPVFRRSANYGDEFWRFLVSLSTVGVRDITRGTFSDSAIFTPSSSASPISPCRTTTPGVIPLTFMATSGDLPVDTLVKINALSLVSP